MDRHAYDRATARGAQRAAEEPRAVSAYVSADGNLYVTLSTGKQVTFPLREIEGLSTARPADLRVIEISPAGTGLRFPKVDADVYVPSLLKGVTGSARWMAGKR